MKYQMINIRSRSSQKASVRMGEYSRPSLRLGRILQTDGSDYRFSSSARLKSGTFLPHSQYNIRENHETFRQPATLIYPSLVVGQGDHRQPIEIIVLVLLQRSFEMPRLRLIQPNTCSDRQLYRRMKENMNDCGIISVSDAEMTCLVSEHRAYQYRQMELINTAEDSIKLVNGDELIVRSAKSDFLGADTWSVEFKVLVARPGR